MHLRMPGPLPARLPKVPKHNAHEAEERNEGRVGHDGRHVAALLAPGGDELGEAVAPDVLVDRDGHEDGARNGLVGIDRVGGGDCGQGGNLDARAGVADYHDYLCVGWGLAYGLELKKRILFFWVKKKKRETGNEKKKTKRNDFWRDSTFQSQERSYPTATMTFPISIIAT